MNKDEIKRFEELSKISKSVLGNKKPKNIPSFKDYTPSKSAVEERFPDLEAKVENLVNNPPKIPKLEDIAKEAVSEIKKLQGNDRLDVSNIRNGEQLARGFNRINNNDERYHGGGDTFVAGSNITFTNNSNGTKTISATGGGTGTVTSVSVVTANGVSGSVANATTTPAITLTLGAIAPSSVAAVGTVSGSNLSGTNTGDQTNITGNAGTVTTNANLTGPITSTGNATAIASQTGTGSKFVVDTSPTIVTANLSGSTVLLENASIQLDPVLSATAKYTGMTITGTAGATLAFGDLIYLAVADSRWELTDADSVVTAGAVWTGMCVLAAANDGDPTTILLQGNIRADSKFPTFTVGSPAYASTNPGEVQVAQPNGTDDVIQVVGFGLTADSMYFNPSQDYITHS